MKRFLKLTWSHHFNAVHSEFASMNAHYDQNDSQTNDSFEPINLNSWNCLVTCEYKRSVNYLRLSEPQENAGYK